MKPQTVVARWTLGLLRGEELPQIAADLLADNHDNQPLREVAGLLRPTLRDAAARFDRALSEAGFTAMTEAEAVRHVALDIAKRIAAGRMSPYAAAKELGRLWSEHGAEDLVAFYACADEYEEHPNAQSEIDEEIRTHAREYVQAHPEGTT